jgi:hypothetical protein
LFLIGEEANLLRPPTPAGVDWSQSAWQSELSGVSALGRFVRVVEGRYSFFLFLLLLLLLVVAVLLVLLFPSCFKGFNPFKAFVPRPPPFMNHRSWRG